MEVLLTVSKLQFYLSTYKNKEQSIGFVPTMGALHDGHLQLVKQAVAENTCCIVSIFVNPTQFNDKNDLETYPRTPEADINLLQNTGCDAVFMPSVQEMYPVPDTRVFKFGTLESGMEGAFRPGHFNGVAQVVSRLFEIVQPDKAYFGEKDFQQIAIIRAMTKNLNLSVNIISCPIVREPDGLAMSSRNRRLTRAEREKAPAIAEVLSKSRIFAVNNSVSETRRFVANELEKVNVFKLDYFEIVDGLTLLPVTDWNETDYVVGCIAVFCGTVRLIDNIVYKHAD